MIKAGGFESDCPRECRKDKKRYDARRTNFCDDCPSKKQREYFKDDVEDGWAVWFGENHGFDFDSMFNSIFRILSCEKLPQTDLSVKTGQLLAIYNSEKSKHDARKAKDAPSPGGG